MDYEKKYKEALKWMRELYPGLHGATKEDAEHFFPELRESEDERIRKELIMAFEAYDVESSWNGFPVKSILAWLEKQKENPNNADSIPADCTSLAKCEDRDSKYGVFPEDVIVVARACEKLEAHGYPELAYALKNVNLYTKEQKPNIELIQRSWYMEGYNDREFGMEPKWIIKTGEGGPKHELNPKYGEYIEKEQKPVDGSDFKTKLAEYLQNNSPKDGQYVISSESILEMAKEELLKRGVVQKTAEWSEEDEKIITALTKALIGSDSAEKIMLFDGVTIEMVSDWLKHLHSNLKKKNEDVAKLCSNEWSEEDEEMLKKIMTMVEFHNDKEEIWNWLCNKVQRLKSRRPRQDGCKDCPHRGDMFLLTQGIKSGKHELASEFMNYLDENRPEEKMSLSNAECEDIDKAFNEVDWAKIMRYYEKYRPSWKPSEEQMEAIDFARRVLFETYPSQHNGCEPYHILGELYEQLKNL